MLLSIEMEHPHQCQTRYLLGSELCLGAARREGKAYPVLAQARFGDGARTSIDLSAIHHR